MKRWFSLILACLLLCCTSMSFAASQTFTCAYFTLTLPEDWEIDTENLEIDDDVEELGLLYSLESIGLAMEVFKVYYEDWADTSLWNATEDELEEYIEVLLESYEDESPEYLETVEVGGIPFVVIEATDEDGRYFYADTMTNGNSIIFLVYKIDEDGEILDVTDEDYEAFKSILETFQPVM